MEDIIISNYSLPSENSNWDYDKSIIKMKGLVLNWKNISVEILNELYIAKKKQKDEKWKY